MILVYLIFSKIYLWDKKEIKLEFFELEVRYLVNRSYKKQKVDIVFLEEFIKGIK